MRWWSSVCLSATGYAGSGEGSAGGVAVSASDGHRVDRSYLDLGRVLDLINTKRSDYPRFVGDAHLLERARLWRGSDNHRRFSLQGEACAWLIEQGWQSKREAFEGIAADRRALASIQASARRDRMSSAPTRLRLPAELEDGKWRESDNLKPKIKFF